MSSVDWNDVRFFVALAGTGGLEKAADRLGVSHVTVMRRVRALEAALGVDLFVRRHDGHRLTAIGAELLRDCREGGALIDDALLRASSPGGEAPPIRITTTELVASWILLPYLNRPETLPPLEIDASPSELNLLDEEATIAVRFRRPGKGPFRVRKLGLITFGLYAAAGLASDPDLGYIGWTGEFQEIGLSRWLRGRFNGARAAIGLTTIEGHRTAAVAGLGIAGLPSFVAQADPGLKPISRDGEAFVLTAWLVVPEALAKQQHCRDAVNLVTAAFAYAGLT